MQRPLREIQLKTLPAKTSPQNVPTMHEGLTCRSTHHDRIAWHAVQPDPCLQEAEPLFRPLMRTPADECPAPACKPPPQT